MKEDGGKTIHDDIVDCLSCSDGSVAIACFCLVGNQGAVHGCHEFDDAFSVAVVMMCVVCMISNSSWNDSSCVYTAVVKFSDCFGES